jgi:hypothetical protein
MRVTLPFEIDARGQTNGDCTGAGATHPAAMEGTGPCPRRQRGGPRENGWPPLAGADAVCAGTAGCGRDAARGRQVWWIQLLAVLAGAFNSCWKALSF